MTTAKTLLEILWCCESYPWSVTVLRECDLSDCLRTAAGLSYIQCCVSRQWASGEAGGNLPFGIQRSGFKFRRSHCSCTPCVPHVTVIKTLLWGLTPDDVLMVNLCWDFGCSHQLVQLPYFLVTPTTLLMHICEITLMNLRNYFS